MRTSHSFVLSLSALCGAVLVFGSLRAAPGGDEGVTFRSVPGQRTRLLELFTSEGCSSCPPAEAALSRLAGDPRLWREFVPVAFHVDYWDNLGWKDRFASPVNTARQRLYAARWGNSSVYTPGFVLDGREQGSRLINPGEGAAQTPEKTGALSAQIKAGGRSATVKFQPPAGSPAGAAPRRTVFVALLGSGITSKVRAGENSGRDLRHEFVALSLENKPLAGDAQEVAFQLPAAPTDAGRLAVAVWVTGPDGLGAEQAVGGLAAWAVGRPIYMAAL